MSINADGFGLNEAMVSAIEQIVNAVAPGAAGVSSVGGVSGNVPLRTVGGITLTDGGGNIAVGGADPTKLAIASNLSDVNNATTARTNLGAAPGGLLITYSGTGRNLANSDNGNVIRCTNAGAVTMTMVAGLDAGFSCVLVQGNTGLVTAVQGASTTLTASPALVTDGAETDLLISPAGTDAYTVYSPVSGSGGATTLAELTDIDSYDLPTNNAPLSDALAALAAASGFSANITGTRGTGNTLTAHIPAAWNSATYQWQQNTGSWVNLTVSATSATYVEQAAEAANDVRCLVSPLGFITNTLAGITGWGADFTPFTETFTTAGEGVDVPQPPWVLIRGQAKETLGGDGEGWFDPNGTNGFIIRDAAGVNGVIEFPLDAGGGGGNNQGVFDGVANYPIVAFRGDVARVNFAFIWVNAANGHCEYYESDVGGDHLIASGTTAMPADGTRFGWKITLLDDAVTFALDSGSGYVTEITATAVHQPISGETYVGLGHSGTPTGPTFGEMVVTAS